MKGPLWEGVYKSFQEVPVEGPGFDGDNWLKNSLNKTSDLRDLAQSENTIPLVIGFRESILPVAAGIVYSESERLRILDFGGGIGFTYYQVVKALPDITGLEYHIVELEQICREGRNLFRDEGNIIFHSTMPKYKKGFFDILHIGSSLQYIEYWKEMLVNLCEYGPRYVLLSNIPAGDIHTFASAQNYHGSKIACWFFNVKEIIEAFSDNNFKLVFKSSYFTSIYGIEQPYPQENFEEKFRIKYPCILLFEKIS